MARCFNLLVLAVALTAFTLSNAYADDVELDLRLDASGAGTWELYAEIITTGGGADGSNGLAAVRALIDGIDFGTNGDGVTIAGGIGAINPIDPGGANERPPVIMNGGTIDLIYGQDISDSVSVVGGIGVGGPALIASGTYSGANPTFGDDTSGLLSDANFLDVAAPGPFGNAIAPDDVMTMVTNHGGGGTGPGDFDGSGAVGNSDLTLLLDNWGATVPPVPAGWTADLPTAPGVGNDDLTRLLDNWGNTTPLVAAASSVPEPTTIAIALLASLSCLTVRRRS